MSAPLGDLTIAHDYESGTTVLGTEKGSPAHHALRANRSWKWSSEARAWFLRSSRYRLPKYGDIELIERALTELGYTVTRAIDESMPSVEQQEKDRAERMDDRSARLAERAGTRASESARRRASADAVFDRIPFGQPEMPGHHSYRSDHNRRARARANLDRSYQLGDQAAALSDRAATAATHMDRRHNPITVGNRIEKLEADLRAVARRLAGEGRLDGLPPEGEARDRLLGRAENLNEEIEYWKRVYGELQAEGKASTAGPDTVKKGDWVLVRGVWYRVRRVNRKSVTVPSAVIAAPKAGEPERTDTTPWREVREHRKTEEMPPGFVEIYETPGVERLFLKPEAFARPDADGSA
jgi:hypothetical protein